MTNREQAVGISTDLVGGTATREPCFPLSSGHKGLFRPIISLILKTAQRLKVHHAHSTDKKTEHHRNKRSIRSQGRVRLAIQFPSWPCCAGDCAEAILCTIKPRTACTFSKKEPGNSWCPCAGTLWAQEGFKLQFQGRSSFLTLSHQEWLSAPAAGSLPVTHSHLLPTGDSPTGSSVPRLLPISWRQMVGLFLRN